MRTSLRQLKKRKPTPRAPYYGNYKLYEHEVVEIRMVWKYADLTQREIADGFGISSSHVSNIVARRFWRNV